mmetsp:Transcript_9284/g.38149  ORF Transcript_9284/g.38149 Transcript_9284/m.38149 type:complete len:203 (+) Transcript_9284:1443-2051(+)
MLSPPSVQTSSPTMRMSFTAPRWAFQNRSRRNDESNAEIVPSAHPTQMTLSTAQRAVGVLRLPTSLLELTADARERNLKPWRTDLCWSLTRRFLASSRRAMPEVEREPALTLLSTSSSESSSSSREGSSTPSIAQRCSTISVKGGRSCTARAQHRSTSPVKPSGQPSSFSAQVGRRLTRGLQTAGSARFLSTSRSPPPSTRE